MLTTASQAGITITAPSVSEEPLYWCGTNCRVYVEAQATGNSSISRTKLTLENESGDETLIDESYGTNPLRVFVQKAYMFDSSHFLTGSELTVKFEAWDLNNTRYEGKYAATVKNNALVAELAVYSNDSDSRWSAPILEDNLRVVLSLGFC